MPRFPGLGFHNIEGRLVTDDLRDKALQNTRALFEKLEKIRTELGLPPDALALLTETYTMSLNTEIDKVSYGRMKGRIAKARAMAQADVAPITGRRIRPSVGYVDMENNVLAGMAQPYDPFDPMNDFDDDEPPVGSGG